MKPADLISTGVTDTFRSKTRTLLTILAIFVGAFTLTLTSGLGTGINRYIDDTVSTIGAQDVMTVTKPSDAGPGFGPGASGPVEYDPDAISNGAPGPGAQTVTALTPADIATIAGIDGVLRVEPTKTITADYIQHDDGTRYVTSVGTLIPGQTVQLAAGATPDSGSTTLQLALPVSLVEPLGLTDAPSAVGQSVTIAVTDAQHTQHTITAQITGVAEETFTGAGTAVIPNQALTDTLFSLQNTGLPTDQQDRYSSATVWFDPNASDQQIDTLKSALVDAGYTGATVADQIGTFKAVIDAIVLVLNAFAVIALLAASFGIVNTLFMSVQERTREIGLMKAMGMGSGRVFSLFSIEAVFIGFLGSAIGAGIGILAGTAVSSALSGGLFSDLPGLTLIAFDPTSITTIILIVMGIAFLAGTLPAARAAKADPVESLRYE